MDVDDRALSKPLGMCGADVVLLDDLQHTGARQARDEGRGVPRQRQGGEDGRGQPLPEAHCYLAPSVGEEIDQGRRDDEVWNGDAQRRQDHRAAVLPPPAPQRGDDSQIGRAHV